MKDNHLTAGGDLSSPALVRQLVWEIYGCFRQGYLCMEGVPF